MAAENIVIKITSEADMTKANVALEELVEQSEAVGEEIENLRREFRQAKQDIAAQVAAGTMSMEEMEEAINDVAKAYIAERTALESEQKSQAKNIEMLKKSIKTYDALEGGGGRMVQQLRAMREALQQMEDAGEFGTEAFVNLSVAAGKIEDQIGDTQQRIRVLSSDTKELDAALGLGEGLAGTFYVAQSAAELFGDDLEALQKAFYKVQAVMSILSGVQQVYNALNKDSAAMVVLNTALLKLKNKAQTANVVSTNADTVSQSANTAALGANTAATGAATAAQWSLNAAMAANPIGVILAAILATVAGVWALYKAISSLIHSFSEAGKAEREYKEAAEELEKVQAKNAVNAAEREYKRRKEVKATEEAEEDALQKAKERNASEVELAKIKLAYAKRNEEETRAYANAEIKRQNLEIEQLNKMRLAKRREASAYKEGSDEKKKALEELTEAENNYYEALQKGKDIEQERNDAKKAAAAAARELAEAQKAAAEEYRERIKEATEELQDTEIELMEEGAAKEIARINLNFDRRIAKIKGKSKEETELRKALERQRAKEIQEVRDKAAEETQEKLNEQLDREAEIISLGQERVASAAKRQAEALTGEEEVEYQIAVWENYYDLREKQIRDEADRQADAIRRTEENAELAAAKIAQIYDDAGEKIEENERDRATRRIEIQSQNLTELQQRVEQSQAAVDNAGTTKLKALREHYEAENDLFKAQLEDLNARYDAHLITYQDYTEQHFNITKSMADAEAEYQSAKLQEMSERSNLALNTIQQVSDLAFEALGQNVQAQMDELDEMYTTDAEEARRNSKKKLISEEELEKKKAALQLKQAKYAKAQALVNAALSAAQAIIMSLAMSPVSYGPFPNPAGIASLALATTMGAAQIAAIAAKPLAQYAKGRKGGKGEYALVGERGAEIMYVPQGASIIPHDKIANQAAWADYGVPKIAIPELPSISADNYITTEADNHLSIDYDRLAEAIAKQMPTPEHVTVNVDRAGVTTTTAFGSHTHLNRKYTGTWN